MIANKLIRRKNRISKKINGTKERPRISVYRSNKYIYTQAIDDEKRYTVTFCHSLGNSKRDKKTKSEQAKDVGMELGKKLKEKKINAAVFDRGIYAYNGRVKQIAEGLRESGITI